MAGNGGAIEEVGKVTDSVIKSLGASPHMLVMILLNLLLVGAGLYLTLKVVDMRNQQMMLLFERCVPDNLYPQYDPPDKNGKSDRAH